MHLRSVDAVVCDRASCQSRVHAFSGLHVGTCLTRGVTSVLVSPVMSRRYLSHLSQLSLYYGVVPLYYGVASLKLLRGMGKHSAPGSNMFINVNS